MITIIDYGLGNLGSILNMLNKLELKAEVTSSIDKIDKANKILLPGVGAFDAAMDKINQSNLLDVLKKKAIIDKVPFLGICLGMQLLMEKSEEGVLKGLGFIGGETKKFNFNDPTLKIPHMGWNITKFMRQSELTKNMSEEETRFYFVHSYHVVCDNVENIIAETHYGYDFASIIQNDNIYGAQFHPEKSHRFGMKLFKNFSDL